MPNSRYLGLSVLVGLQGYFVGQGVLKKSTWVRLKFIKLTSAGDDMMLNNWRVPEPI